MKLDPYLNRNAYTKINSKLINCLNISYKSINLNKYSEVNLHGFLFEGGLLEVIPTFKKRKKKKKKSETSWTI